MTSSTKQQSNNHNMKRGRMFLSLLPVFLADNSMILASARMMTQKDVDVDSSMPHVTPFQVLNETPVAAIRPYNRTTGDHHEDGIDVLASLPSTTRRMRGGSSFGNGTRGEQEEVIFNVGSLRHGGTGCPAGSVTATFSQNKDGDDSVSLSLFFTDFIASTSGDSILVDRQRCNLGIPLTVQPGIAVGLTRIDYRGFSYVPEGSPRNYVEFEAEYFFAGRQGNRRRRSKRGRTSTTGGGWNNNNNGRGNGWNNNMRGGNGGGGGGGRRMNNGRWGWRRNRRNMRERRERTLQAGEYEDFTETDRVSSVVWSQCGRSPNFRIIAKLLAEKDPDLQDDEVEIGIDTLDLTHNFEYLIQWRACD